MEIPPLGLRLRLDEAEVQSSAHHGQGSCGIVRKGAGATSPAAPTPPASASSSSPTTTGSGGIHARAPGGVVVGDMD